MTRILSVAVAWMRQTGLPPGFSTRTGLIIVTAAALALGLRSHPISAGGFSAAMAALLALEALELLFAFSE